MVQDKLVLKEGEWFERYVEKLFNCAGFQTSRDPYAFINVKGVTHKFDVIVLMKGKKVIIECKDIEGSPKECIDTFVGKLKDVKGMFDSGVFCIAQKFNGDDYKIYRNYANRHGIIFYNADDLEELWKKIVSYERTKAGTFLSEKILPKDSKSTWSWLMQDI